MTRIVMLLLLGAMACGPSKGTSEDSGASTGGDAGAGSEDSGDWQVDWPGGEFSIIVVTDPDDELAAESFDLIDQIATMDVYYYETRPTDCRSAMAYPVAAIATGVDWGGTFTVPEGWVCAWADFYWVEEVPGLPDILATECYGETSVRHVAEGEEVYEIITLACTQYDVGQPD